MSPPEAVALIAAGFVIGAYATAIGAGGGFLVAPMLLIRYPDASPPEITTASLAVVAITSTISSVVIARERIVDRPLVFAMATVSIPAAMAGALGTSVLPRDLFALGFAVFLFLLAGYIVWRPVAGLVEPARRAWRREIATRQGLHFRYRVPIASSVIPVISTAFLTALAGIGGGPIGVPVMTRVMRIPHAVAVPSMHLLIAMQATIVVALHLMLHHGGGPLWDVPFLGIGVAMANPFGQKLRRTLGEGPLMRALAFGLIVVALTTAWSAR